MNSLGCAAVRKGNWVEAINYYTKAIQINNKNHLLFYNRSLALEKAEKYEEALEDAENIINVLQQFWAEGYFRLGQLLIYYDFHDALRICEEGLQLDPNNIKMINFIKNLNRTLAETKDLVCHALSMLQKEPRTNTFWSNNDSDLITELEIACATKIECRISLDSNKIRFKKIFGILFEQDLNPPFTLSSISTLLLMAIRAYYNLEEYRKCIKFGEKLIEVFREHNASFVFFRNVFLIMSDAFMKLDDKEQGVACLDLSMNVHRLHEITKSKDNKLDIKNLVIDVLSIVQDNQEDYKSGKWNN